MLKGKLYIFIVLLTVATAGFAQQDPQFTQYMYTILPTNPGYAGNAGICASLHYRQQWAGFTDVDPNTGEEYKTSPRDILLTVHSPIKALHGGLGLTIYNDAYGHQNDIAVKIAYAFRMNIGGGNLGIGLSADFLSRALRVKEFIPGSSGDPTIVSNLGDNDMYVDFSLGAYYQMQDKWYAGLSATQLVSSIGGDKVNQRGARHFYALGGYSFSVPSNPNWTLKPSALLKTDLTMVQLDLTLLADYNNLIWFGASYRMIDAVALIVGAKPFINSSTAVRGLEIVASYDINTSKIMSNGRSYGGYEFCLKYCFNIVTKPSVYGYKGTRLLGNKPIEYR
ncbi:MAG: PorP/SprF family type IX secretion system membrane protein [Bacteroidales bacterium]|jgi:type IX secretion system PorP/SprF family membrane protein|nr:PorP/SprF family type IX secretion system membrane protein [Bacteroidales bacterium]